MRVLYSCINTATKGWATGDQDHFVAVAEYSYEAENPDELSFQQGNSLNVAPKGTRSMLLLSILYRACEIL